MDKKSAPHSPLTYNSYLKVSELKQLQVCESTPAHHDEPLFIIIHQSYELWFKLILHEFDAVFESIKKGRVRRATFYMHRINEIMKLLVQQIHILETMKPKEFLGFRYNLSPASGFQSSQFREIEFAGGIKDIAILEHFRDDKPAFKALKVRYDSPSLADLFYELLAASGIRVPAAKMQPGGSRAFTDEQLRELTRLYVEEDAFGDLHDLAESLVEFDEQLFFWRVNHVTVVERMIGFKRGTGGSEGVGYLRSTLDKRCFPELWQIRTYLEDPQGDKQTAPAGGGCPMGHK
jgi:tryptophan 2,3-dioxygenase